MKRALICGVSGQDGSYLARLLLSKGYEVFGTSRDAQSSSMRNLVRLGIRDEVTVYSVSLRDILSVKELLTDVQPDEVFNLAGQSSVALSFEQPVETMESIFKSTLNFLEVIRFNNPSIKYYNACSSECFGDTSDEGANELTPFRPKSPYAVVKAAAYWQVSAYREAYGLLAYSGILFNHESPLRPERFVTKKVVAAACRIASGSHERLHLGNTSIMRDWGWAPEYVEAIWLMLQQDCPNDYVIATGESRTLEDFVETAFLGVGLDWRDHVESDQKFFRPTDIQVGKGDPIKAREKLGWRARYKMHDVVRMMLQAERGERMEDGE